MNPVPVTSLYAGLLGLLLVVLSIRVVRLRLVHAVSLGDGGHADLLVAQRQQGNFVEYVPFALGLVGLLELSGIAAWSLHALGGTLVGSRLVHPFGLATKFGLRLPRVLGIIATWLVLATASLLLLMDRIR